jgi:hypothetical protein
VDWTYTCDVGLDPPLASWGWGQRMDTFPSHLLGTSVITHVWGTLFPWHGALSVIRQLLNAHGVPRSPMTPWGTGQLLPPWSFFSTPSCWASHPSWVTIFLSFLNFRGRKSQEPKQNWQGSELLASDPWPSPPWGLGHEPQCQPGVWVGSWGPHLWPWKVMGKRRAQVQSHVGPVRACGPTG